MIEELKNTPNTMVGFRITAPATREDFDSIVLPAVAEVTKRLNKLNYLLIVDDIGEGAVITSWLRDAMSALNSHKNWNKGAIVTSVQNGDRFHSKETTPGEFKTFRNTEIDQAIDWVSEQHGTVPVQMFADDGERED